MTSTNSAKLNSQLSGQVAESQSEVKGLKTEISYHFTSVSALCRENSQLKDDFECSFNRICTLVEARDKDMDADTLFRNQLFIHEREHQRQQYCTLRSQNDRLQHTSNERSVAFASSHADLTDAENAARTLHLPNRDLQSASRSKTLSLHVLRVHLNALKRNSLTLQTDLAIRDDQLYELSVENQGLWNSVSGDGEELD